MILATIRRVGERIVLRNIEGGREDDFSVEQLAWQVAHGTKVIWTNVAEPPGFATMVATANFAPRPPQR